MASKQNGSSIPSPRPPFRRQGSSIGAGAHPMAVALAPVPRIDYSVTKGGARTWAVLLVFLFLCSGLYTIFSSKELNGNDANIQNDQQEEVGDDSQSYTDLTPKQRRNIKESQDSDIKEDSSEVVAEETDADDEETVVEPGLEDQLFAGLRRKIEKNIQRVKEFVKEHENDKVDEDAEESKVQAPLKRGKRRKNKHIEISDDVQEPAKCSQHHKRKGKADRECEEEAEVEEDDTDDVDSKDDELPKAEPSEEDTPAEEDDDEDEKDEKDDEDDDEEESKTEERFVRKQRSHGFRHLLIDIEPERECRRKHCPPDYHAAPRKSLLKKKYKGPTTEPASARQEYDNPSADEDDEDEEEDEEEDQPDPRSQKHNEVVALNKRGSGREAYKRQAITNRDDHKNRDSLDRADTLVEKVKVKRFKKSRKWDSL